MNGNNLGDNQDLKNTYRATSNLNTAIENPQINMNSAMGVNIQNVDAYNNSGYNTDGDSSFNNFTNANNNMVNNDTFSQNTYYNTTANLNTEIENPQFNMNNVMGVNIQDVDLDNSQNDNSLNEVENNGSSFISSNSDDSTEYGYVPTNDTSAVYEPVMQEKKKKEKFEIPRELKVMFFIVFILVIFILVTPYIYDFFREIKLSMMAG